MPNALAYLMLALWPLVCLVLFRQLKLERAIIWSILGGYLILPPIAEFNLPLVPSMDKSSIPNVFAWAICVFVMGHKVALWPRSNLARVLVAGFVLGVVPTVMTNGDPLLFRSIQNTEPIRFIVDTLPGLSLRDLFSVVAQQVIVLLPFFLGRQYLAGETGMRELLLALVIAGVAYSIPSLIEIRLSPQINVWVYGFFQHSFEQMMRSGGFRPIVFLPHGLWLAFFFFMTLIAAAALSRTMMGSQRVRFLTLTGYLAVILVLCKSYASLAYGLAFTPVILLASPRVQLRLALFLAAIAVIYPMLRNAGLIPLDAILAQAEALSPERAQSLGYRFDNEEQLLARAQEKTWFGWGGWGRNLIRDSETAEILSVPDGRWIIVFGMFGWVGYIAEMGLLATPLVLLAAHRRATLSPLVTALAIILAATMMDMLLNATLIPFTWLCAGALLGHAEHLGQVRRDRTRTVLFPHGVEIGGERAQKGRRTVL